MRPGTGAAGSPSGAVAREIGQVRILRKMGANFLIGEGRYRYGKGVVRMNPVGPDRNRKCL